MKEFIIINFTSNEDAEPKWVRVKSGEKPVVKAELDELKFKAKNRLCYALIPSAGFSCFSLDIKTKSHKKILQAAKFALRDKVLAEMDEVFLAIDQRDNKTIWICEHELIGNWLEHFTKIDLRVDYLIPQVAVMAPVNADFALWLQPEDKAILYDGLNFISLDSTQINLALKEDIEQEELKHVETYGFSHAQTQDLVAQNPHIEFKVKNDDFIDYAAKKLNSGFGFNLLQGEYAKADALLDKLKPWRLSAILLLLIAALALLSSAFNVYKSKMQADKLRAKMQNIYAQAFPTEGLVSDPYQRLKTIISSIAQNAGNARFFSELLSDLGPLLKKGVQIGDISFSKGKARVKLLSNNLSFLEQAAGRINKKKYKTKLLSVSEENSQSVGVLEVEFI